MLCPEYRLHFFFFFEARKKEKSGSLHYGMFALGKARLCSTPCLSSFTSVAIETVPMLVGLAMALPRPFTEESSSASSFNAPLFRAITDVILSALRPQLKLLNTSDLPRREPLAMDVLPDYLIDHFLRLRHVRDSTSTGVFENGC